MKCPKCGDTIHAMTYNKGTTGKQRYHAMNMKYCEQCKKIYRIKVEEA